MGQALSQRSFGMQDHQRCGARVFACVVMLKLQIQQLFEVAKAVTPVAFQLGPCPARDSYTIGPMRRDHPQAIPPTGSCDGFFIISAVLHKRAGVQHGCQILPDLRKRRRTGDQFGRNAMQVRVERNKRTLGINKHRKRIQSAIQTNPAEADLTNTVDGPARCLDIDRDKAKRHVGERVEMAKPVHTPSIGALRPGYQRGPRLCGPSFWRTNSRPQPITG